MQQRNEMKLQKKKIELGWKMRCTNKSFIRYFRQNASVCDSIRLW